MAYVPKDWVTGEVITEQALDHIEQGIAAIGGGVALLNITEGSDNDYHLGKSYNEIAEIVESGNIPVAVFNGGSTFIMPLLSMVTGTGSQYAALFLSSGLSGTHGLEILGFSATAATEELVYIDIN